MSTFKIKGKPQWVMLWLMLASIMFGLGGEAEAATLNCDGCHGKAGDYRPLDSSFRNTSSGGFRGNHRTHMGSGATASTCSKCHSGSDAYDSSHRDGKIKLSANINNSPHPDKARYKNSTSAFPQTSTPSLGSCNNVNCHFEKETKDPFKNISGWGGSPLASAVNCNFCHDAPPKDGHHPGNSVNGQDKHGAYLGTTTSSCNKCHTDHASTANFTHSTSAGHRPLVVRFTTFPNSGGTYSGYSGNMIDTLPSQRPADKRNGTCSNYCHSDGKGGAANVALTWSDNKTNQCFFCHKGRSTRPDTGQTTDNTEANCINVVQGKWSSTKGYCTPDLVMSSNGHHRLVGGQWIRKYPCYYCHNNTVAPNGKMDNISSYKKHVNGKKDVAIALKWNIDNRAPATYNSTTQECASVYCHSDGTEDPEDVRPFAWTRKKTECNSCHGHPIGTCDNANCHDERIDLVTGKYWPKRTGWTPGNEWMGAMPMFPNKGPGTRRANSHSRHAQTLFSCDVCHSKTILGDGCVSCHEKKSGSMGEVSHLNPAFHVDKVKNVSFRGMSTALYDKEAKSCSGVTCHPVGDTPVWGGSVNSAQTCLSCHGTTGPDMDDFNAFSGNQGKINLTEWKFSGHGRISSAVNSVTGKPYGNYPKSKNPAAKFPINPCWYCHDNNVLHKDKSNPFRLQQHNQYKQRFEKECVYCHMTGTTNAECLSCHRTSEHSLAPQLGNITSVRRVTWPNRTTTVMLPTHKSYTGAQYSTAAQTCLTNQGTNNKCHNGDAWIHNSGSGSWSTDQKADVKNQYMMMGVCLQCHDDDSSNQCTGCHLAPADKPLKYSLGFNPGTGFIKPKKARASAGHFGYKHYKDFKDSGGWLKHYTSAKSTIFGTYSVADGTWKGGKFCWDCHDPHGDSNIYMIQAKVATETDGIFGVPRKRKDVVFTDNASGTNYVKKSGTGVVFDGICNVCHSDNSKHFTNKSGDSHNFSRRCTNCHEHRFADSHAGKLSCNNCHKSSKPIPKHTAFGLPRDCTKCHTGEIGSRMDVMGQMRSRSHHVQGVEVNNKHCYQCHWEATADGLINIKYHTGYNYKTYSSVKNDVVDLVKYGPGSRPTIYKNNSSAVQFRASNLGLGIAAERAEVGKITNHCISCHSDQNNDATPFDDCKTPRHYAWDLQSVAARYSQTGTATWGKYAGIAPNAAQKNITKAFSAHGYAIANGGGWDTDTGQGLDGNIVNSTGDKNVQCFDCHNSHGSKVVGVTSSYLTFNGTYNGSNLKATKATIGGYASDYEASPNTSGVNPYAAAAGQCFDCHLSANARTDVTGGKTPWGYTSFGATAPIMGYKDTLKFGQGIKASTARFVERDSRKTILGGHLMASQPPGSLANLAKDTGTVTSGTTTSLTDNAKNWTPNDKWKNLYVLMVDGNNIGKVRKITASTAKSLTVEPFAAAPEAGKAYKIVPYSRTINGLCTACHDPHGVSPTLGDNRAYALPLLKGTWMTSPYKEDQPAPTPSGANATAEAWGHKQYKVPTVAPYVRYNIDHTTFTGSTRISETDEKFAGLCLKCHKKGNLTDGISKNQSWKSMDRIHESVKGWGANTEHSYTCSKCHQAHNSGLPRLMQTDCLDYKHRFNSTNYGGQVWNARDMSLYGWAWTKRYQYRGFPVASIYGGSEDRKSPGACHERSNNGVAWPNANYWNNVTPWVYP